MRNIDWTLLVLASAEGDSLSPVQLQKAIFLAGQNIPVIEKDKFYSFKPYNYGPFSQQIYFDAETLASQGLISIEAIPGQNWKVYRATQQGVVKAEHLRESVGPHVSKFITNLVNWIRSLEFKQLLLHVYRHYPDMARNSMLKPPS